MREKVVFHWHERLSWMPVWTGDSIGLPELVDFAFYLGGDLSFLYVSGGCQDPIKYLFYMRKKVALPRREVVLMRKKLLNVRKKVAFQASRWAHAITWKNRFLDQVCFATWFGSTGLRGT